MSEREKEERGGRGETDVVSKMEQCGEKRIVASLYMLHGNCSPCSRSTLFATPHCVLVFMYWYFRLNTRYYDTSGQCFAIHANLTLKTRSRAPLQIQRFAR